MTSTIRWKLDLFVNDGPSMSIVDEIKAEAYDRISVTVPRKSGAPPTATVKTVSVQPAGKGEVQLLIIKSSPFKILKYSLKDAAPTPAELSAMTIETSLDSAHVLLGASLVNVLSTAPKFVVFKNDTDIDAEVEILVARTVKP
jgi:hypothetical protein